MKRGDLERGGPPPARPGGELARMARPVLGSIGFVLRLYHWPVLLLVVLYFASGVTSVKPGEVALVLRFGKLVGDTPAEQVHRPGLLFALPQPIDEVVRVDVEVVRTLAVRELTYTLDGRESIRSFSVRDTIDPELHGYVLTGDRNVLQADFVVRYRVADPIAWTLGHDRPEDLMRDAVMSAIVQGAGERAVDDAHLGEGRTALQKQSLARAQAECDGHGLGVDLIALEFKEFMPPFQVLGAFNGVVDAFLMGRQAEEDANRYYGMELPAAAAEARRILADARNSAGARVARARGESDAFRKLVEEVGADRGAFRERLYREAIERAFLDVTMRVLPPPPEGERYHDFRITLPF